MQNKKQTKILKIIVQKIPKKYEIPSANLSKMYHRLISEPTSQVCQEEMSHALHLYPPACKVRKRYNQFQVYKSIMDAYISHTNIQNGKLAEQISIFLLATRNILL